jgi:hypothetical protein
VQIYRDEQGHERTTWVSSDGAAWDFGPPERAWEDPLPKGIVVTKRTWLE